MHQEEGRIPKVEAIMFLKLAAPSPLPQALEIWWQVTFWYDYFNENRRFSFTDKSRTVEEKFTIAWLKQEV